MTDIRKIMLSVNFKFRMETQVVEDGSTDEDSYTVSDSLATFCNNLFELMLIINIKYLLGILI